MIEPLIIAAALAGSAFAAWGCYTTWSWPVGLIVFVVLLGATFFLPFGPWITAAGSVALFQAARTALFKRIASGELDDEDEIVDVFE